MRPKGSSKAVHLASTYQLGGCEMGGGVVGFTDSTLGVWPQFEYPWGLLNLNFSAQVVLPTEDVRPWPSIQTIPKPRAAFWISRWPLGQTAPPRASALPVCSVKGNSREEGSRTAGGEDSDHGWVGRGATRVTCSLGISLRTGVGAGGCRVGTRDSALKVLCQDLSFLLRAAFHHHSSHPLLGTRKIRQEKCLGSVWDPWSEATAEQGKVR